MMERVRTWRGLSMNSPSSENSVRGELDVVALELERPPERLANGRFVVDNQDLHASIVRAEPERSVKSRAEKGGRRPEGRRRWVRGERSGRRSDDPAALHCASNGRSAS